MCLQVRSHSPSRAVDEDPGFHGQPVLRLLPPELICAEQDLRAGLPNAYRGVRELTAAFTAACARAA